MDELALLLADDDARWESFGLNIPSSPRAPEPASSLALLALGSGKVLAEWERGARSNNVRVLIQVVGVDVDFRECGKSGGDSRQVIKDLPVGSTLRVRIVSLNGSLEGHPAAEAQTVVG